MFITFRRATPADAERLNDLYAEACSFLLQKSEAADISPQWEVEWFDKPLFNRWTRQGRIHIWETLPDKLVGAAFLETSDSDSWPELCYQDDKALFVHKLYVARDYAGAGFGAAFLDQISGYAEANGKSELRLDCLDRAPLTGFYQRNGFQRIDTMNYFDRPAVRWRKPVGLKP